MSVCVCVCVCLPHPGTGSHVGMSGFVQHAAAPVAKLTRERAAVANAFQQPRQPAGSRHASISHVEGDGEHSFTATRLE